MRGVDFSSQDYLSLSSHSGIKETAKQTIEHCGVHSAGSAALVGHMSYSVALERKVADFLKVEEVVLYPTGWAAGFGVIKSLASALMSLGRGKRRYQQYSLVPPLRQ